MRGKDAKSMPRGMPPKGMPPKDMPAMPGGMMMSDKDMAKMMKGKGSKKK